MCVSYNLSYGIYIAPAVEYQLALSDSEEIWEHEVEERGWLHERYAYRIEGKYFTVEW